MSKVGFAGLLAKVNRVMNATDEEREALRVVAIALYAPSSDEQGAAGVPGSGRQGTTEGDGL